MRALQTFIGERPERFGAWFSARLRQGFLLPWGWDEEDAERLLHWFNRFGWREALAHPGRASRDEAAAAMGTLLALTHVHCFAGVGDYDVWQRLGQLLGLPGSYFGDPVHCLIQKLPQVNNCEQEVGLKHLLPFLRLVGLPPQVLPAMGLSLRATGNLGARHRELLVATWGDDAEERLLAWLRQGQSAPAFLSEADQARLNYVPPRSLGSLVWQWGCLESHEDTFRPVLFPVGNSDPGPGPFVGSAGQKVDLVVAKNRGVPQVVGEDGRTSPQSDSIPWPVCPSFWVRREAQPLGVKGMYEHRRQGPHDLVCLPPGWSVDGEPSTEWQWIHFHGRPCFFKPDGGLWSPGEDEAGLEAVEGLKIVGHPELQVVHRLPQDLLEMCVRSGALGSTLDPGSIWRPGGEDLPPMGHLTLTWRTRGGREKSREVYCLPTLVCVVGASHPPRVWLKAFPCMDPQAPFGKDVPLNIQVQGRNWKGEVGFAAWGRAVRIQLSGTIPFWGAKLQGPKLPGLQTDSPWTTDRGIIEAAYRAGVSFRLQLPAGAKAHLWLEQGGRLFDQETFENKDRLPPLRLKDPLLPIWDLLGPMARPLDLSLAWSPEANGDVLEEAPLLRLFPLPTWREDESVEFHRRAVIERQISAPSVNENLVDPLDQTQQFIYDLAADEEDLEGKLHRKVDHWLDRLDGDFLTSQPWTLALALRNPGKALAWICEQDFDIGRAATLLGNLGQSGWSWWFLHPSCRDDLPLASQDFLAEVITTLSDRRQVALKSVKNPSVRRFALSRLCEEGLFTALADAERKDWLEAAGFPCEWMHRGWTRGALRDAFLQMQEEIPLLSDTLRFRSDPTPGGARGPGKPLVEGLVSIGEGHVLQPLSYLIGWARDWNQWKSTGKGSLIARPPWAKGALRLLRHDAILFSIFALLNWEE